MGRILSIFDAARYLNAAPANIAERHAIRRDGIALLKKLHDPASGYDQIVIVGHSLGSVIGYDMLKHYGRTSIFQEILSLRCSAPAAFQKRS